MTLTADQFAKAPFWQLAKPLDFVLKYDQDTGAPISYLQSEEPPSYTILHVSVLDGSPHIYYRRVQRTCSMGFVEGSAFYKVVDQRENLVLLELVSWDRWDSFAKPVKPVVNVTIQIQGEVRPEVREFVERSMENFKRQLPRAGETGLE